MLEPDKFAFNFIDILENGKHEYKLVTTIRNVPIKSNFRIQDNNNYILSFTLLPDQYKKGLNLDYFFQKPFGLVTDGMRIFVHNFKVVAGNHGLDIDSPCDYKIEINSFKGDADESMWKQSKQRAYIKYCSNKFNPYSSGLLFDLTTEANDNGFYNAVSLKIENMDVLFYHERTGQNFGYFVIWSKQEIDFEVFQPIVNSVITAFGFLNGFYMLDTIYYFTMKEIGNTNNVSFYYENFKTAINSNNPIIDSGNYVDISEDQRKLSSAQFNRLVNLLFNDQDYLRAAYLLIETGTLNKPSKASLAAVALETITSKIGEKMNAAKIIEEKKVFRGLVYKLKKVLKEYQDSINKEQFSILSNKLNAINTKPNSSKFTEAFDQLGLSLSDEELECIKSRNLFLHGNLPRNKKSNLSDQELLGILANRLVMLSSILLLKLIGFEGYVIDRGMTEVIKWRMIMQGQKAPGGNFLRNIAKPDHLLDKV